MEHPSLRTVLAGSEEASFTRDAVDGLLYAVLTLPVAIQVAPYARFAPLDPYLQVAFKVDSHLAVDSVVWVLVVLGPPVVFGAVQRGLVPAFLFVFPATHALCLLGAHAPGVVGSWSGVDIAAPPPPPPPYAELLLWSLAVTLVCVTVAYAWGRGIALLYREFAEQRG